MRVREYIIWVNGFNEPSYSSGKSRGEAKYNLWLKVSDCGYWENFFDFARQCKCKLFERCEKPEEWS